MQTIVLHRQSTDQRYDAWRANLLGHEPFELDRDIVQDPLKAVSFARLDKVASDGMGNKHVKALVIDGLHLAPERAEYAARLVRG